MKDNPIEWYVNHEELHETLKRLKLQEEKRRDYSVLEHKGERFFVKYFKENGILGRLRNLLSPRGKKEYETGKRLIEVSINTPKPLGYGISKNGSYVVQEWIDGTTFLDVFMAGKKREELLFLLVDLLRALKVHGILHNDLHLDNIFVSGGRLYLIDLHKTVIKSSLSRKEEIVNIAHAVNMVYDDLDEEERGLFFDRYGEVSLRLPVEKAIEKMRDRWVRRKKKRAFKNTSKIEKVGGVLWIRDKKGVSDKSLGIVKKDRKVLVERYEDHIRKYYKSKRRLLRAWENHVVLLYLKLRITPEPYCTDEGHILRTGFIAMEDLKGKGEELDRYLDRRYDEMGRGERRDFIERLADFFSMLFKKGIYHTDMKACNIFVCHDGSFRLLDVEDIIFRRIDKKRLIALLLQLNTTVPLRISTKDRMRFFIRITESLPINRKEVFFRVKEESLKSKIVYEGKEGLKIEDWG
ncbi:MAG: hypothetical protein N2745_06325 [Syntrophorhabdaceae bacterium]|nr:hypothetical protein [Syntrophorhabdaceae bacterium]